MFNWFNTKKTIDELQRDISRPELIRRSRILVIDDELPEIVAHLKNSGFAVDHVSDVPRERLSLLEGGLYDVILLDYKDVGTQLGNEHGLSILRHLKRTSPATIAITYTSKALKTEQSDFFRLSDGSLMKDAGLQESIEKIEEALKKAHSIRNVWMAMLSSAGIEARSKKDLDLQDMFVRGLSRRDGLEKLNVRLRTLVSDEISKTLVAKLIEIAVKCTIGV